LSRNTISTSIDLGGEAERTTGLAGAIRFSSSAPRRVCVAETLAKPESFAKPMTSTAGPMTRPPFPLLNFFGRKTLKDKALKEMYSNHVFSSARRRMVREKIAARKRRI
jgi:hypothetical protein